jgi:hypothetical protein
MSETSDLLKIKIGRTPFFTGFHHYLLNIRICFQVNAPRLDNDFFSFTIQNCSDRLLLLSINPIKVVDFRYRSLMHVV